MNPILGKSVKMERIMNRNTGNCVIVPMDHSISIKFTEGLFNMKKTMDNVANGDAHARGTDSL